MILCDLFEHFESDKQHILIRYLIIISMYCLIFILLLNLLNVTADYICADDQGISKFLKNKKKKKNEISK